MKHPLLLLTVLLITASSTVGQVSSTNGTFTATTPSNLSLQAGATPTTRLTILNSNGNIGINTTSPSDWLHVNGNARANQFNAINGIFNTLTTTNLSLNTNGTNRMTILGSGANIGFVGIGTAAPTRPLTVMAATPSINIQTSSVANDANVRMLRFARFDDTALGSLELYGSSGEFRMNTSTTYFPTFYSNGVEAMRINTAGNVGIGTTSPAAKLNIVYAGNSDPSNQAIQIQSTNAAAYGAINLKNDTNDIGQFGLTGSTYSWGLFQPKQTFINSSSPNAILLDAYDPNGFISFGTGGAAVTNERMRIDKSGFVGIGISNPSQILHVHQATYAGMRTTTNLTGSTINDGVNFGYDDSYGAYIWNRENSPIIFSTNNTEKVRVTENGNVGIGTATPAHKLDVAGTINASSILVNGVPISGGGTSQWATNGSNISYASGNVGIGTSSPAAKLNIVYPGNTDPSNQAIQIESTNPANYGSINLKNSSGDLGLLGISGSSFSFPGMFRPQQTFLSSGSINGIALIAYDINAPITFGTGGSATTNERMRIDKLGNIGIGTTTPDARLAVKGTIHAQEVKVDLNVPGPDYVFEPTYNLKPLAEVETYIKENKHLPEVPSAKEMKKNGVQLGEMNVLLLKKVEELTLYSIEQNKKLNEQQELIQGLIKEMQQLKTDSKKTKN